MKFILVESFFLLLSLGLLIFPFWQNDLPYVDNAMYVSGFLLIILLIRSFQKARVKTTNLIKYPNASHTENAGDAEGAESLNIAERAEEQTIYNDVDISPTIKPRENASRVWENNNIGNWALPGFQALFRPVENQFSVQDFSPCEAFYHEKNKFYQNLFSNKQQLSIECLGDIEAFSKAMLLDISSLIDVCVINLCLRDRLGNYQFVLQRNGKLFVSKPKEKLLGSSWETIIHDIEKGKYILLENQREVVFPIASSYGALGLLHFQKDEGIFDQEILGRLWMQIREYGEILLQSIIYEEANFHPQSSFKNQMRFQEDIQREFAFRHYKKSYPALFLFEYHSIHQDFSLNSFLEILRDLFPFPYSLYELGEKYYALLGVQNDEVASIVSMVQNSFQRYKDDFRVELRMSIASEDLNHYSEWFSEIAFSTKV